MSSISSLVAILLLIGIIHAAPAPVAPAVDVDKNDLQQLQFDQKVYVDILDIDQLFQLNEIQQQLTKLQDELNDGSPQLNANPSKTEGAIDQPIAYIDARQNRQIGWQPMRRLVAWQPMKKAVAWQPFKRQQQPAMIDDESVRDQMVQVVEQNLLDDLRAAQKYGIEPQEILADLRYRNQMHRYQ